MIQLTPDEARVLGVLVEKERTTPDQYPLTLNAIVNGASQKNNRDPVAVFDEDQVRTALNGLRGKGLVTQTDTGGRASRYKHAGPERLGISIRELALLTELMLRGPQTLGELRGRASRMHPFESLEGVRETIQQLINRPEPLVRQVPPEPGTRAEKFAQLLTPLIAPTAAPQKDAPRWPAVDAYLCGLLLEKDPALDAAVASIAAEGMPEISVSAAQGKFLHLLAKLIHARNILEVGTLGGYSTIWLARALPADGKLITLELEAKHVQVARANLDRAGVADKVEVHLGRAIDSLPKLHQENRGPFDLVFIDADKTSNADYFQWAMKLTRPGSLIVVDNVVRKGQIIDADSTDASVQGTRRFLETLSAEKRVSATVLQTVGAKGYDGLALALVL